ncbi:hypothetical protein HA402_013012 [Bradysia odoriphaga]|nr:hypothetical protein HA402_013012 [Bradysia odoriphaga]
MPNSKKILKLFFALGVWSFLVIGLFRIYEQNVWLQEHSPAPLSGWLLLQNEDLYFEATPKTTNRIDDVLIDNREEMDDESLVKDVASRIPSLPIEYWSKYKNVYQNKSSTCAKYPSIFELEFNNIYWQTLRTSNGTFQLFGAYYDVRKLSLIGPSVRIVGMIDRIEPKVQTYCQLWFDGQKEPHIVKTFEYKYIWHNKRGNYKQGIYQPYLIACQIPNPFHSVVPASVSIVEKECDTATNNLRVIYNRPRDDTKKGFAVCVKGLDFLYDDLSVRLVEWIELLRILGAEKIYFYELHVHPNISKILRHYENEGMVQVTPLTLPGGQPNVPGFQHLYLKKNTIHKRQNEIIPYNDCLYKNLYLYDFIALLDIDEVIMPKYDMNWHDLMKRVLPKSKKLLNETYQSYNVRNVYFLDVHQQEHGWYKDIPKYLHMLQHVHRAQNYTKPKQYVKCFHNTEEVLTLHNHFPVSCLGGVCQSFPVSTDDAQMHHYRASCVKTLEESCGMYRDYSIKDTSIWRFKDQLISRSVKTLDKLGFLRSSTKLPESVYKVDCSSQRRAYGYGNSNVRRPEDWQQGDEPLAGAFARDDSNVVLM